MRYRSSAASSASAEADQWTWRCRRMRPTSKPYAACVALRRPDIGRFDRVSDGAPTGWSAISVATHRHFGHMSEARDCASAAGCE